MIRGWGSQRGGDLVRMIEDRMMGWGSQREKRFKCKSKCRSKWDEREREKRKEANNE